MLNPNVLCQITESQKNISILFFKLVVESPSHYSHKRRIFERSATFNGLGQLDFSLMIILVARFTERYQIVGSITACFSTLDMMNIQNLVFAFAFTALTGMPISEQNILSNIPETQLIAVLVAYSFNIRILDFLNIEASNFNRDFCDGEYFVEIRYNL